MPVVRRLLLAGVVTAAAVGGGVLIQGAGGSPPDEQEATSTPLASFDTTNLAILRTAFCDRVADDAVEEALGGAPDEANTYGNGDRARLAPGIRDRAHEYGCSWTAAGRTAAAWVYAPPVSRAVANELLRQARAAKGCGPVTDAPAYGEPSAGLVCTSTRGSEVTFRGLFGDAWLVCSLRMTSVSAGESTHQAVDRAGRWCVAAARAAGPDDAEGKA